MKRSSFLSQSDSEISAQAEGIVHWTTTITERLQGLEHLAMLDQVVIKQETHLLEVLLPFEVSNKYAVCNNQGQRIFYAAEQSSFVCRQCCGHARPFVLKLCDNSGVPILHVERPCNCGAFCRHCCCCSDFILVNCESTGEFLGKVEMKCNPCCFGYRVFDGNHQQIASIAGPCAGVMCMNTCTCQDQRFEVTDNRACTCV
ncbi:phospholipid scramblase 1-like [Littorina saxatilis]|uniref:phospholipid scramblase 1-like n=1 Tax=Littorina saxatilis TaxID=31220 RepID=UPI0038B66A49